MSFGRRGATRASVFPTLTTKQAVRASRAWFSATTTPTSPLSPQRQLACGAHARASRLHGFPPFILGTRCCASFRSSRPASAQAPGILRPPLGFPGGEESEGGEIKNPQRDCGGQGRRGERRGFLQPRLPGRATPPGLAPRSGLEAPASRRRLLGAPCPLPAGGRACTGRVLGDPSVGR